MLVATAVSRLVDGPEKTMNFDVEELEDADAERLFQLVAVNDVVGSVESLRTQNQQRQPEETMIEIPARKKPRKPEPPQQSKIIAIEEVESDPEEESEDEDLIPYQKPDDDPDDSDEDPTLINRDKPAAPVYIIDLIKQLQNEDKPDVVEQALKTAPSLIRRKANFGTEVSDNVQVIASTLLNLKAPALDTDELHRLRQQSLIACLIAQPRVIPPWLASMYFEGDFSLDQRASILSTLGFGARELAGQDITTSTSSTSDPFPSQRLPPHLASIYAPIESTAQQLEHNTMQPLALAAADKLSGPDVLKVRTFSSRLDVEKRHAATAAERRKRIPKDLHALLADFIFLPLCSRLSLLLSASSVRNTSTGILDPSLLRLALQTLIITLNALGPNAMQLGAVSREAVVLLGALTGVRMALALDPAVLPACLHLLLVVLELGVESGRAGEERLVGELGEGVAALVRWVAGLGDVVDGYASGGSESGGTGGLAPNVLAAGVQVRWQEIGRRFQGRMLGLMGVEGMEE